MNLLALDLGTNTGYAISSSGVIVSGVISFKPNRYEGGGMRYLKFRRWLDELHSNTPIKELVFEEVRRHAATDAAHVHGGLLGILTAWCESEGIPYQGVPVGTIKASWTGKGNSKKEAMIAEANRRGFQTDDDNEADALALLHYWIKECMVHKPDDTEKVSLADMMN